MEPRRETMANQKLDLLKEHKACYVASKKPVILDIAAARYMAIDGQGAPGGEEFQEAVGALYAGAFTMKMASKSKGQDYAVCKLEALWWADGVSFPEAKPEQVRYKLMIRIPDFIVESDLNDTLDVLKKKDKTPRAGDLRLESLDEGRCVQMLHLGPYDREAETIQEMQAAATTEGLALHGLHHEIYLSDPRRVPPDRLRTILRHPVRPA